MYSYRYMIYLYMKVYICERFFQYFYIYNCSVTKTLLQFEKLYRVLRALQQGGDREKKIKEQLVKGTDKSKERES